MRQSWNRCERDGAAWLLLGNDFEILASAIQPIMVEEDDLMIRWSRQNLPVKIAKAVFAIDFAVSLRRILACHCVQLDSTSGILKEEDNPRHQRLRGGLGKVVLLSFELTSV